MPTGVTALPTPQVVLVSSTEQRVKDAVAALGSAAQGEVVDATKEDQVGANPTPKPKGLVGLVLLPGGRSLQRTQQAPCLQSLPRLSCRQQTAGVFLDSAAL